MGSCSINPLSWGQCVQNAVNYVTSKASSAVSSASHYMATLVEGVILWMYNGALTIIVDIVVAVGQSLAAALIWAINLFASIARTLGIFALPFLLITTVALAAGVYLAFMATKDAPVVGAFE